ncbi:phosphoribosylanthranilate isomerase [Thalassomonas viridans]|uniref:N-(5'-phosphoribosyl)anthranilate isomerase n=1 Tax=Thalassomonas viridans TaxID=137584 RepID=A0AAE9Z903_9GAMM|nr:phosphoribosylanthranilate isomerase [Thalassomonas viridans]WDE08981.1 phosphoribosylanthranilate isomerase [Thalassomonas viridans]
MNKQKEIYVKICGITNVADAQHALKHGAGAIGLVFVEGSVRQLSSTAARELVNGLAPTAETVGVFSDQPLEYVQEVIKTTGIKVAQLHGHESPDYCRHLPVPVIKRLTPEQFNRGEARLYQGCQILVDSGAGSGELIDWRAIADSEQDIILAGGLDCDNVVQVIQGVRPQGVDVSSGCESARGIKDHRKMADFIAIAKQTATQLTA